MINLARYLLKNYYARVGLKPEEIPSEAVLAKMLDLNQDKVVVVHKGMEIIGVAVFLTLTDATYDMLDDIDIGDLDTMTRLIQERGDNIHFFLLTADSVRTIMAGLRAVQRERNPRTVSWWDPENKRLHRYNFN